jgi:hypothetical protein
MRSWQSSPRRPDDRRHDARFDRQAGARFRIAVAALDPAPESPPAAAHDPLLGTAQLQSGLLRRKIRTRPAHCRGEDSLRRSAAARGGWSDEWLTL